MAKKKYMNEIQVIAAKKYSSIKSRVTYDLEKSWSRKSFILWYERQEKICYYCNSTLDEIQKFYNLTNSKRKKTRGKSLEIDRLTDKKYSEDNCVLACYWCNNAKSDVFEAEEFKNIGKAIGSIIRKKIKN